MVWLLITNWSNWQPSEDDQHILNNIENLQQALYISGKNLRKRNEWKGIDVYIGFDFISFLCNPQLPFSCFLQRPYCNMISNKTFTLDITNNYTTKHGLYHVLYSLDNLLKLGTSRISKKHEPFINPSYCASSSIFSSIFSCLIEPL